MHAELSLKKATPRIARWWGWLLLRRVWPVIPWTSAGTNRAKMGTRPGAQKENGADLVVGAAG